MLSKEIVKILQKYQDNNQKELTSINEDIQDIILQLKYICSSNISCRRNRWEK